MTSNSSSIGFWFLGFGAFLILCGLAGYLSNPEAAKTALMSGGTFGLLSAAWGGWMVRGGRKAPFIAALLTTSLLCFAFTWRSIVGWQAVMAGEDKLFAASLISTMLVASVASIVVLFKGRSALFDS